MRPIVAITLVYIGLILLANWWWHPVLSVAVVQGQGQVIGALQRNLAENMSYGLPAETAALLRGIMLGEKTEISRDIKDMFSDTGVMHILAVSGLNVGMVAVIFFFIFTRLFRLKRKQASFLLIFVLVIFAQVTGLQASVNRAVVMAIVGLVAVILERDRDMVNSICLAALLLLLSNPRHLFNVGFQLSFAATLGLILFTPKLMEMMKPLGKIVSGSLAVTFGAQLAVTPLIMYYFHKLSIISPLANLAVVPLVGVITGVGFASYFLRLLFAPLGNMVIQLNHYLLVLMIAIVRFFDRFPYAFVYVVTPGALAMALYYGALWWWRTEQRQKYLVYGLAGCFMVNIGVQQLISRPLAVSFIDVGQGDSILVQLPDRQAVLIDGGGSMDPERSVADRRVAPYLWNQGVRIIDTVILTQPHYNHLQGLLVMLDKFKVRQVIIPVLGAAALRQDYMREFLVQVRDKKIYLQEWRGGEMIRFSQELRLESRPGENQCLVTKLVYKDRRFLFTSDGNIPVNGKADVVQVPKHGKDLFDLLPPAEYLVVSSRVAPADERIWSTKRDGNICFTTNGQWLKVRTSK
ncbi:MAG: DNA internalization-related competence protein ComEC/Rec2 [Elusimicrobia bacterium]|nr:DNA internalization-related competence protein ComEC/Rec2 [Elusimicrobiota bacterium]